MNRAAANHFRVHPLPSRYLRLSGLFGILLGLAACSDDKPLTVSPDVSGTLSGIGYHASPTGQPPPSGDGSIQNPWNLATALNAGNGVVQAGDTIWLHDGTYPGQYTATSLLSGTSGSPIIVRQYPGEHAIIDGASVASGTSIFRIDGHDVWFWGFTVMSSKAGYNTSEPNSVYLRTSARNVKLVNMIIHDGGVGVYSEPQTSGSEIYGSIIYNIGYQLSDRGHGHALYLKQDGTGSKLIADNVMFNQFGFNIHTYSDAGSGDLKNMTFDGNVAFNAGGLSDNSTSANILMGGQEPVTASIVRNNFTYMVPGLGKYNVVIGDSLVQQTSVTVTGNKIVGGAGGLFRTWHWNALTVTSDTLYDPGLQATQAAAAEQCTGSDNYGANFYYRNPQSSAWKWIGMDWRPLDDGTSSDWKSVTLCGGTDQGTASAPTTNWVYVRPNAYDNDRGHIIVYNWSGGANVTVNVSSILEPGESYEVRSVQNLNNVVASGSSQSGTITIPLAAVTPTPPVGGSPRAPVATGPTFDVFLLTRPNP